MNKGLLFLIIILSLIVIVVTYTIYFWASSKTNFTQNFYQDDGIEFFEFQDRHLTYLREAIVTLNTVESGAPLIESKLLNIFFPGVFSFKEGLSLSNRRYENVYGLQVFLQNAQLKPKQYVFENPLFKQGKNKNLINLYSSELVRFEFTLSHAKLVRELNVQWQGDLFALGIDPKRPYGDATFFALDMAEILDIDHRFNSSGNRQEVDQKTLDKLNKLHDEMVPAMQVLLRFGRINNGKYYRLGGFEPWQVYTDETKSSLLKRANDTSVE